MTRPFIILFASICLIWVISFTLAQNTPTIALTWDANTTTISGTVEVRGTVNPPGFQSYFLEAAPFTVGSDTPPRWTPISLPAGQPVDDAKLGDWNTPIFPDGIYQLRIHVVLVSGESAFYTIAPIAINNAGGALSSAPVTAIETPGLVVLTALPTNTPVPTATQASLALPPSLGQSTSLPIGGHVAEFKETAQNAMRSAGMTWVKFQVRYRLGDTIDAPRDAIERGHRAGFRVLLGVVGEVEELRREGEAYYAQFAAYLGQLATLNPDAIEVWNEPNIDREWPTGLVDPRRYADMLRVAYISIKAVNPNITVISAALSPTGAEGAYGLARVWNDNRYYQVMATTDIPQHADCIGMHYNEGIVPPDQTFGDPRDNYPTRYLLTQLERVNFAFRGIDIPICVTELGYLTPEGYPPLPGGFAWAGRTTLAQQAAWLAGAANILETYEPMPVQLMIIWNIDFTRYDDDPMAGYAIIRADGTCPACAALAGR
jgi:hypothetical protein